MNSSKKKHIVLNSHPTTSSESLKIHWGASTPQERGPIITNPEYKNCIGSHSGSYSIYRALAVASDRLDANHKPNYAHTQSYQTIGPFPSWSNPEKIVSMDPFGADVENAFKDIIEADCTVSPSIAITTANVNFPELNRLIELGNFILMERFLKKMGIVELLKLRLNRCGTYLE